MNSIVTRWPTTVVMEREIGTEGNEDPGEVEQRRTDPIIFEYRGQFPLFVTWRTGLHVETQKRDVLIAEMLIEDVSRRRPEWTGSARPNACPTLDITQVFTTKDSESVVYLQRAHLLQGVRGRNRVSAEI